MKNIFISLISFLFITSSFAQEQRIPYQSGEIQFFDFGNLVIEGYDGNEIIITEKRAYSNESIDTRGMKLISSKEVKAAPELTINAKKGEIEISGASSWKSYHVKVPRQASISCKSDDPLYSLVNWDYSINNIDGEVLVYVMELVDVQIKNSNGPVSILTHGNIYYEANSLNSETSISLDTYRGSVNVLLPEQSRLSVNLAAKAGNIYSAFNITDIINKGAYLLGQIKNGGTALKVNAEAGGNIYLRKK